MARKDGIDRDRCLEIVAGEGLTAVDRRGWIKVEGPGGQRVYISSSRVVRHVHLSDFGLGIEGTLPWPDDRPNGRVRAYVDMEGPDPEGTLRRALGVLKTLGPPPPRVYLPRVRGRRADAPKGDPARRAVIAARAPSAGAVRAQAEPDFDGLPDEDDGTTAPSNLVL